MRRAEYNQSIGADSDEALVRRAGMGDRRAAGLLIGRYSDRIMSVCYRMLGDQSAAEDAAQETFLRLWKSAGNWKPAGAKFSTWLYRVASNVCLDRLRVRGREITPVEMPESIDPDPLADQRLEADDCAATVRAAIADLPERQRLAIILRHYEGMSNIEAADAMEVSVDAVESLLGRAKRALRVALASVGPELMQSGDVQ